MLNRTERCWVAVPLLLAIAVAAVALQAGGETHTWSDEAAFEGGDWEATTWDHDSEGITLTGRYSFWKDPANPVIVEGSTSAWDDEGILEPSVVFAKGQYYVYYTGYDGSEYGIGLARSTDGLIFSKYGSSAVVSKGSGGTYDGTGCREPSVIYEDGLFKMWYTGINGATESIAYATSKDGLSWTKYGSNPVLSQPSSPAWGDTVLGDPCVIRVDGMYLMYLTGNKVSGNNKLVGVATSSDGTSWNLHGSNPLVSEAPTGAFGRYDVCDVAVVKDGPLFRMYFSGRDSNTDKYKIGYGESFDGFTWTLSGSKYIGLGASGSFDDTELNSPSVIMEGDGVIHMYYEGNDATDYEVGRTTYMPWLVKPNLPSNKLLGTGSTYDSTHLLDPCVIKTTSGTYAMFYGSYQSSNTSYYVAYATSGSPDSSWSKSGNNPHIGMGPATAWDDEMVGAPCVIFDQGLYKMWYAGNDGTSWKIGYATASSLSGSNPWTKYGSNPVLSGSSGKWDASGVRDPWVLKVGNTYHMWYVGWTGNSGWHIGHATSTDGTSWTKDSANPILAPDPENKWEQYYVFNPCVVRDKGRYVMYYSGTYNTVTNLPTKQRTGIAYSDDGTSWTKDPLNPVIDWGNGSYFDDDGVSVGSVLIEGGFHHVYTHGYSGANFEIGYASFATKKAAYTTPVLDASSSWPVHWGTLSWDAQAPLGTTVRFQVATNSGGTTWRFVGPDGTQDTYFTDPDQNIHWFQSGKYLRVRLTMETDDISEFIPLVRSITVTYGPRSGVSPPQVTVTSPNGGEDWMKTKAYPITWEAAGNLNDTSVSLEYSTNNGTSWTSIATRQQNTGFYKWTVPSTETSGALIRVSVIDIDGMMAVDTSDATFAIDPPAPKAGAFHVPAQGDTLTPGAVRLSWTVEDPWGLSEAPLSLELTTDGGITWTQLASGMPFTDGIQWDVPALATSSDGCRLRLSVRSWLGDVSVIESGEFTVDVAPPIISWDDLPGRMVEGRTYEVAVTARDDLAIEVTVLHVSGAHGERDYTMSETVDGLWTFGYEALEGDETMWVSVSDGAYSVETSVMRLDVVEKAAASGGSSASLAFELALAAVLAVSVTLVVALIYTRRRR